MSNALSSSMNQLTDDLGEGGMVVGRIVQVAIRLRIRRKSFDEILVLTLSDHRLILALDLPELGCIVTHSWLD